MGDFRKPSMILAHEKFGVEIKNITEEYGISVGAYYYWSDRYVSSTLSGTNPKKLMRK